MDLNFSPHAAAFPAEARAFPEESAAAEPMRQYHEEFVGDGGLAGPTIIAHGSDAQKQRHVEPMLAAEQGICWLFSEPRQVGSDSPFDESPRS